MCAPERHFPTEILTDNGFLPAHGGVVSDYRPRDGGRSMKWVELMLDVPPKPLTWWQRALRRLFEDVGMERRPILAVIHTQHGYPVCILYANAGYPEQLERIQREILPRIETSTKQAITVEMSYRNPAPTETMPWDGDGAV